VEIHSLDPPRPTHGPLAGIGVVVTRPQRQAAGLAQKLDAVGAMPLIWPAIVILPPHDDAPLKQVHATLASYDFAIFVSANAVEYGVPDPRRWPASLRAFAPGPGTAEALAGVGIVDARIPASTFDTEGLLALPELQDVGGRRVLIFRGQGGRELLGDTLMQRGARVDYVSCYRRAAPQADARGLVEALANGRAHALTLTSAEGADNLLTAIGADGAALLARIPAFVPHPHIAGHVRAAGLRTVVTTPGGDAGLIAGLLEWFAVHPLSSKG
jgi:uroporphyrinogen-III synthase